MSTRARRWFLVAALALLVAAGVVVAWRVPVPADPPAVALNSEWVFRGEVFLGFFVGAYVVLAICATTILSGRPPKRLGFGLLTYEQAELDKTVEAIAEGGTALQAVESEAREGLRATRGVLEELIRAAEQSGADAAVVDRARTRLAALSEPDGARGEFDEAMARFERLLGDLEELRGERRR